MYSLPAALLLGYLQGWMSVFRKSSKTLKVHKRDSRILKTSSLLQKKSSLSCSSPSPKKRQKLKTPPKFQQQKPNYWQNCHHTVTTPAFKVPNCTAQTRRWVESWLPSNLCSIASATRNTEWVSQDFGGTLKYGLVNKDSHFHG